MNGKELALHIQQLYEEAQSYKCPMGESLGQIFNIADARDLQRLAESENPDNEYLRIKSEEEKLLGL